MLTLCVISFPRNVLSLYGEVYFRAWRVASGAYLKVHNLLNFVLFEMCNFLQYTMIIVLGCVVSQ